MNLPVCPKCESKKCVKSGVVKGRQRYKCKKCGYYFTVNKLGKEIDPYFVTKALQLYIEGVSYREIERLLGISHVSVMNWVKKYKIKIPREGNYHPTYRILTHDELLTYVADSEEIRDTGMIITSIGDKFMLIKWEKFKK
ncbi:MAG: helix-turn-helix domain-containing protein [Cyclobacteriaceae bacterium]